MTTINYDIPPNGPRSGETERQEFSALEKRTSAEIASASVAAAAKAAVESRYVIALQRPRNYYQSRDRLLKECTRPGFAEVAWYSKPMGGRKVVGPSIRFAEAFLRTWGNVLPETAVIYDDDERRVLRVSVTDLEANLSYSKDVSLLKRVERSRTNPGQKVFGQRLNSDGRPVFIVEATEDDLANKEAALASKALRQLALRLCPGDLLDEAEAKIRETLERGVTDDPESARKRLVDAFSALGVQPAQLEQYLGHPLGETSPAEVVDLRQIYAAVRDGEATWRDVIETRAQPAAESKQDVEPPQGSRVDALKHKLRAKVDAEKADAP